MQMWLETGRRLKPRVSSATLPSHWPPDIGRGLEFPRPFRLGLNPVMGLRFKLRRQS